MTQTLRFLFTLSLVCLSGLALSGCGNKTPALPPSVTPPPAPGQQAADGHDEHGDHDHPEHGTRGGHMIELSDGSKVEVMHADDLDMFTVWADDPDNVTKVEMITTIDGTEKTYPFEKTKTFTSAIFGLTNPELATAAQMGEGVDIKLVIAYPDRELTGKFEHHAH